MSMPTTPGVHVKEVSTLPPSVAEVSTAVPAFLGYTEVGSGTVRIRSMLEYTEHFGGPPPTSFEAEVSTTGVTVKRKAPTHEYLLYHSMQLYFENGGGDCYVVSVGNYGTALDGDHFTKGLKALELEDEPTLIVCPDAVNLDATPHYGVYEKALTQCDDLKDRFAILDVREDDPTAAAFRNDGPGAFLEFGAAYLPFLHTGLKYPHKDENVKVTILPEGDGQQVWEWAPDEDNIRVRYVADAEEAPRVNIFLEGAGEAIEIPADDPTKLILRKVKDITPQQLVQRFDDWAVQNSYDGPFQVVLGEGADQSIEHTPSDQNLEKVAQQPEVKTLKQLEESHTATYHAVKAQLARMYVTLPPSPAIAGVYARVDRSRGVWKAPANEALLSVREPAVWINDEDQGLLNVDPNAGKSINAIRKFAGKGTLVWGARTLAGNDNEWRYVPVRRLFNMIEESTKKASAFAVFEPNDSSTWLKVQAMIESFLFGLWQRGALMGSSPDQAYFVSVGLGKTMTMQDVLEGRMFVEIGVAAVRPAEFIILRFSHRIQAA